MPGLTSLLFVIFFFGDWIILCSWKWLWTPDCAVSISPWVWILQVWLTRSGSYPIHDFKCFETLSLLLDSFFFFFLSAIASKVANSAHPWWLVYILVVMFRNEIHSLTPNLWRNTKQKQDKKKKIKTKEPILNIKISQKHFHIIYYFYL